MSTPEQAPEEITPVDDTRRVRERLEREANGDVQILAEKARAAAEKYRHILGLRLVPAPHAPKPSNDA